MAGPISVLLIATLVVSVHCNAITVRPSECVLEYTHCNDSHPVLGDALENMTSDTTLHLMPGGSHDLWESKIIQNFYNVTLVGHSLVTVTCKDKMEGVGMAFINITRLTIQNITFQKCGLSGNDISEVDLLIKNRYNISTFYQVPSSVAISIILGHCMNVTLRSVTVTNTTGLGLLGVNIIGESSFIDVTFSFNAYMPDNCIIEVTPKVLNMSDGLMIGGGAILIYYDYSPQPISTQLTISNCIFTDNRDCSISSHIAHFLGVSYYSNAIRRRGYQIGGGGGLTLILTQLEYSVNITTRSSSFKRNAGRYGGGAHVTIFKNVMDSSVSFEKCSFVQNGQQTNSRNPDVPTNGGGIAILTSCIRPLDRVHDHFNRNTTNHVRVFNSNFTGNLGFIGGGIYLWSFGSAAFAEFNDLVIFKHESCLFQNNSAVYGAALYAYEQTLRPTWSGTQVEVSNLSAQHNNIVSHGHNSAIRKVQKNSGIIAVHYITLTMRGLCTIAHNNETGLYAHQSAVYFFDEIVFKQNVGTFGGAICLLSYSYLIIHDNTVVEFSENHGRVKGGAFYVDYASGPDYKYRDCFLYLNSSDVFYCDDKSTCSNIAQLNISITFFGNTAPVGGVAYGSTLSTCFWGQIYQQNFSNETDVVNFWEFLYEHKNIFHFDTKPVGIEQVTTPVATLSLKGQQRMHTSIMPGQRFNVTLAAQDHMNQSMSPAVAAAVMSAKSLDTNAQQQTHLKVGSLGITYSKNTEVPITLVGEQKQTIKLALYTIYSFTDVLIEINMTTCKPGFKYDENLMSCIILPKLRERGIEYTNDSSNLVIPNHIWLGELKEGNSTYMVVEQCLFDYCKPLSKSIIPGDYDSLCAVGYNRMGLLCGSCREGYSIVFGSRRCKMCPNNHFLALIIVFAIAGLLLLAVVAFVKVNVSEGYLYSILLYSHIVSQYITHLTPDAGAVFIPTAFLNLNIGVQTCFYNGMTSLTRSGLQFVFPFYIYALMGIIILLARYVKWPRLIGFSAGKTFATLLVLSYTNILQTCCDVLTFTRITTIGHEYTTFRWMADPNVNYFRGMHAVLSIIALILMLVYIIPLPCILLFPAKAYRLRYVRKMKPIFDAFWAPFEPNFRFWLGIRFLILSIFMEVTAYTRFPQNSFLLVVFLVFFTFVQTQMRPYRGMLRNAVDAFLLTNATALLVGAMFFDHLQYIRPDSYNGYALTKTIFSAITVSTAYIVFIAVFLYHIFLCLPQKVQNCCKKHLKVANKFFNRFASTKDDIHDDYYLFEDRDNDGTMSIPLLSESPQHSVMDSPADEEGNVLLSPAC